MNTDINSLNTGTKAKSARDLHAFVLEKLYDDYAPTLYGVILRIVKDELIAEDALSNCFLRIKNSYHHYKGASENLIGWLIQHARLAAREKVQDKFYRAQLIANELYKCQLYLNEDEPCGLYEKVKNISTPVPEEYKTILDMLFFEGLTIVQIAEKLDLDQEEVKQQLATAVKLMRDS